MNITWEMFLEFLKANEAELPTTHYRIMKIGNTVGVTHCRLDQPIFIVNEI